MSEGRARAAGGAAPRVLVVEDDDAMRDLLVEELAEAGFDVIAAGDGRAGIDRVRREAVDLVITDLRMPELDGFDLIRDVRATPQAPPIVMVTAFGSIETAIKAVKLGAYDYITKPFEIEELLLCADKALAERQLRREVARLREQVEGKYQLGEVVARSAAMQDVLGMVRRIAPSNVTVLITGESGTGKELIARAIHQGSDRAAKPFVAINLAAVPGSLLESELFGHKRGAFTDARQDRVGLFEEASGGTIFLDEIGELAPELQAKLLRVLQEQEIRPLGATKTRRVDVRVVAATNRDLEELMAEGRFREDLYYRLAVLDVSLPSLRQRPDDIVPLAEHFLARAGARANPPRQLGISAEARAALQAYHWPGNVRELMNVMERGMALSQRDALELDDLPSQVREPVAVDFLAGAVARRLTLEALEREYIERVLDDEGGNKTRTAQRLGLDRKTLYRKLEEWGRGKRATTDPEPTG